MYIYIYLGGRASAHRTTHPPFKYNQKLSFLHLHHNKYLNQTSRPIPIISLICPESESIKIWVRTHLFLPLGQKEIL